jgi:thiamine transport system substrate-binding protein
MYVYPVGTTVDLPADWRKYAPAAEHPATMAPAEISKNRESWIEAWSEKMEG